MVRERLPLVPVTVRVKVPLGVAVEVVTVRVELFAPAGLGLNVPPAPPGSPLTEKLTAPAKPPLRAMFTVYVVEFPRTTVREVGVTESEKSGGWGAAAQPVIALQTLSRPPVTVTPLIDGIGSTLPTYGTGSNYELADVYFPIDTVHTSRANAANASVPASAPTAVPSSSLPSNASAG